MHAHAQCLDFDVPLLVGGTTAADGEGAAAAAGAVESGQYYEMDDQAFCEGCYLQLWRTCGACHEVVGWDEEGVKALENFWHREHFTCCSCARTTRTSAVCAGQTVGVLPPIAQATAPPAAAPAAPPPAMCTHRCRARR